MNLEVSGVQYTNFTSAVCDIRLDALSNSFSFEAVAPNGQPLPFKGGDSCKITIDNETVLTGHIEVIAVDYSGNDHVITISGRDKTSDLLDSTLGIIDDIRADGLTLKILIEKIIDHLGIDILVIDKANPDPYSAVEDLASPEPGDNAFSFIEKYARKRQVLLTSNGDGNIVITKNTGINSNGVVQHIIGATDNNVMTSNFSFDTTGRYNAYKLSSELNPVTLNQAGDTDLESVVNQGGGAFDHEIRPGRQLIIVAETPYSDADCAKRSQWEANIRKARGLIYSAVVPGFRIGGDTGDLWQINRIYQIVDDFAGKIEPMLCNSVKYSFGLGGRVTSLGFVGQKAYTQFLEDDPTVTVADNVA